jgi:hypothetical protein
MSGLSCLTPLSRLLCLWLSDHIRREQDLPLQICLVHTVKINDADPPDTGRRQIQQGGRAKATRAHAQDGSI